MAPPSNRNLVPISVLAASLVLGGCGGGGPESTTSEEAPGVTGVAEEVAPAAEESSPAATEPAGPDWGPALENPERYYGLYANPETPGREWFVTEAKRPEYAERAPEVPPGHLAVGAMFGDVAPWQLRTVSQTEFEQVNPSPGQPEPVRVEFERDADGRAVAMRFTGGMSADEGRMERVGELPEDW